MNHPFHEFLETNRLTLRAFAVFNGISLDTLRGFMYGKCLKVPANIKMVLSSHNINTNDFEQKYMDWLLCVAKQDVLELQKRKEKLK